LHTGEINPTDSARHIQPYILPKTEETRVERFSLYDVPVELKFI